MRSVPRTLIDAIAPLLLLVALSTIHWFDRSSNLTASRDSRGSLLDLAPDPYGTGFRSNSDPDQRSLGVEDAKTEEQGNNPANRITIDRDQPQSAQRPSENFVTGPRTGLGRQPNPQMVSPQPDPIAVAPTPLLTTLEPPKQSEQVRFFKLEAKAESVVFLVDGSGSMAGDRFARAQAELARAIGELNQYQSFAVAFFNHDYLFMRTAGGKKPSLNKSNSALKSKAIEWMQSLQATGGTNPEPALIVAAHLKPDVIFLLTDGEFRSLSPSTLRLLKDHQIKVFTVGFDSIEASGILKFIADQTGGEFRSALPADAPHAMFLESSSTVMSALDATDPTIRLAAIIVAFSRELTYVRKSKPDQETNKPSAQELAFARKIPEMLKDSDDRVRQEVHHRLVLKAMGSNFGPHSFDDPAETALAIERWAQWCSCFFEQERVHVVKSLSSTEPTEQWIAASVIRIAGWDVADDLISNLGHVSMEARREIRAALQALAKGQDFGPEPDANDEQVALSVTKWSAWRVVENQKLEDERVAKLQKKAAEKLRVAEMFSKGGNKGKARVVWQEIIKDFEGTSAAEEAKKRLE